jgi:hypothetical protein
MREFKFFQKGTTDMMDGEVRATASFNADTPEGHMSRRALYQTNPDLYGRLRHPNNEMERYFYERNLRHDNLTTERRAEIIRRINEGRDLNDNPIRLFNTTTVTKVNPKWWMKIKIALQESWLYDPIGVVVVSALTTIVTIIGIAKLLNAW